LNSLKVPFEKTKAEGNVYNSKFNEKIARAAEDKKNGHYKSIKRKICGKNIHTIQTFLNPIFFTNLLFII
jgi:hypothetical protein